MTNKEQPQKIAKSYNKWSEIIFQRFWNELQAATTKEQIETIEKKYTLKIKRRNAENLSKLRELAVRDKLLEARNGK